MGADYNEISATLGDAVRSSVGEMNVYDYLPAGVAPPAVIVRDQTPTGDYMLTWGGGLAEYMFEVLVLMGKVSSESAQTRIGELITRNSALIKALNDVEFSGGPGAGHAHVRKSTKTVVKVGNEQFACAKLAVLVRA